MRAVRPSSEHLADLEPGHRAAGMGEDGAFLDRLDPDLLGERAAGGAGEGDAVLVDLHLGRRDQAEGLEELLHGAEAGRGRPLHGIGPAVGLVPAGDGAVLEQRSGLLGSGLGLGGDLARLAGAGQHAVGEGHHRHLGPHHHRGTAAVGLDVEPALEFLAPGPQALAHHADRQAQLGTQLKELARSWTLPRRR